jgi:hypothetical protein
LRSRRRSRRSTEGCRTSTAGSSRSCSSDDSRARATHGGSWCGCKRRSTPSMSTRGSGARRRRNTAGSRDCRRATRSLPVCSAKGSVAAIARAAGRSLSSDARRIAMHMPLWRLPRSSSAARTPAREGLASLPCENAATPIRSNPGCGQQRNKHAARPSATVPDAACRPVTNRRNKVAITSIYTGSSDASQNLVGTQNRLER